MPRAQRRHDTSRIKARFYRKQRGHACWKTDPRNAGLFANHGKFVPVGCAAIRASRGNSHFRKNLRIYSTAIDFCPTLLSGFICLNVSLDGISSVPTVVILR